MKRPLPRSIPKRSRLFRSALDIKSMAIGFLECPTTTRDDWRKHFDLSDAEYLLFCRMVGSMIRNN